MSQIGSVRLELGNGTKELPVYDGELGINMSYLSCQTPNGVGKIPFIDQRIGDYYNSENYLRLSSVDGYKTVSSEIYDPSTPPYFIYTTSSETFTAYDYDASWNKFDAIDSSVTGQDILIAANNNYIAYPFGTNEIIVRDIQTGLIEETFISGDDTGDFVDNTRALDISDQYLIFSGPNNGPDEDTAKVVDLSSMTVKETITDGKNDEIIDASVENSIYSITTRNQTTTVPFDDSFSGVSTITSGNYRCQDLYEYSDGSFIEVLGYDDNYSDDVTWEKFGPNGFSLGESDSYSTRGEDVLDIATNGTYIAISYDNNPLNIRNINTGDIEFTDDDGGKGKVDISENYVMNGFVNFNSYKIIDLSSMSEIETINEFIDFQTGVAIVE